MKHFLNVTVIIATLAAPTLAWAQSPSVTYRSAQQAQPVLRARRRVHPVPMRFAGSVGLVRSKLSPSQFRSPSHRPIGSDGRPDDRGISTRDSPLGALTTS